MHPDGTEWQSSDLRVFAPDELSHVRHRARPHLVKTQAAGRLTHNHFLYQLRSSRTAHRSYLWTPSYTLLTCNSRAVPPQQLSQKGSSISFRRATLVPIAYVSSRHRREWPTARKVIVQCHVVSAAHTSNSVIATFDFVEATYTCISTLWKESFDL